MGLLDKKPEAPPEAQPETTPPEHPEAKGKKKKGG
jgi:hypothetical protein